MRTPLIILILAAFLANVFGPIPAQAAEIILPAPGNAVALSHSFKPASLRGMTIDPQNPLAFEFILDKGEASNLHAKRESLKLIKYFLAALTTPEKDLWVNLSPYEKGRIVPEIFGQTAMGRELLAQDYLLKQVTATLFDPNEKTGQEFWSQVYAQSSKLYGHTNIPIDTFNKVWIMPDQAKIYEKGRTVFVVKGTLKVMLESDYQSFQKNALKSNTNDWQKEIVRKVVIPVLTKEINEGESFSSLRQVYYSLILAAWYKKRLKKSLLSKEYVDQNKVKGIEETDGLGPDEIYERYLKAFKKGVLNLIREEKDLSTGQIVPRKYFSGGYSGQPDLAQATSDEADKAISNISGALSVQVDMAMSDKTKQLNGFWNNTVSKIELTKNFGSGVIDGLFNNFYFERPDGFNPKRGSSGLGKGDKNDTVWMERINEASIKLIRFDARGEKQSEAIWIKKPMSEEWVNQKAYLEEKELEDFWSGQTQKLELTKRFGSGVEGGIFNRFYFEHPKIRAGQRSSGLLPGEKDDRVWIERIDKVTVKFTRTDAEGQVKTTVIWFKDTDGKWINQKIFNEGKLLKDFWSKPSGRIDITELIVSGVKSGQLNHFYFEKPEGFKTVNTASGLGKGNEGDKVYVEKIDEQTVKFIRTNKENVLQREAIWVKESDTKWAHKDFVVKSTYANEISKFWSGEINRIELTEQFGGGFNGRFFGTFRFGKGDEEYKPDESTGLGPLQMDDRVFMERLSENEVKLLRFNAAGDEVKSVIWIKKGKGKWAQAGEDKVYKFWSGQLPRLDITHDVGGGVKRGTFHQAFRFGFAKDSYQPGQVGMGLFGGEETDRIWMEFVNEGEVKFIRYDLSDTFKNEVVWIKKPDSEEWINQTDFKKESAIAQFRSGAISKIEITSILGEYYITQGWFNIGFDFDGQGERVIKSRLTNGLGRGEADDTIWMERLSGTRIKFYRYNRAKELKGESVWVRTPNGEWVKEDAHLEEKQLEEFFNRTIDRVELTKILGYAGPRGKFDHVFSFGPGGYQPKGEPIGLGSGSEEDLIWMEWIKGEDAVKFVRLDKNGQHVAEAVWMKEKDKWQNHGLEILYRFWNGKTNKVEVTQVMGSAIKDADFNDGFYFNSPRGFYPKSASGLGRGANGDRVWMERINETIIKFTRYNAEGAFQMEAIWTKNPQAETWSYQGNETVFNFWAKNITRADLTDELGYGVKVGKINAGFRFGGPQGYQAGLVPSGLGKGEETDRVWGEWIDEKTIDLSRIDLEGKLKRKARWEKNGDGTWSLRNETDIDEEAEDVPEVSKYLNDFWQGKINKIDLSDEFGFAMQQGLFTRTFRFNGPQGYKIGRAPLGLGRPKPGDTLWMERISENTVKFVYYDREGKVRINSVWKEVGPDGKWENQGKEIFYRFWAGLDSKVNITDEIGFAATQGEFNLAFQFEGLKGYKPGNAHTGLGSSLEGDTIWIEKLSDSSIKLIRQNAQGDLQAEAVWMKKPGSEEWFNKTKAEREQFLIPFWSGQVERLEITDEIGESGLKKGFFNISFYFESPQGFKPGLAPMGIKKGEETDHVWMERIDKNTVRFVRLGKDLKEKASSVWVKDEDEWHEKNTLEKEKSLEEFWSGRTLKIDVTSSFNIQNEQFKKSFRFGYGPDAYKPGSLTHGLYSIQEGDEIWMEWAGSEGIKFSRFNSQGLIREVFWAKTPDGKWMDEKNIRLSLLMAEFDKFWAGVTDKFDMTGLFEATDFNRGEFPFQFRFYGQGYQPLTYMELGNGLEQDKIWIERIDQNTFKLVRRNQDGEKISDAVWAQKDDKWEFQGEEHLYQFWTGKITRVSLKNNFKTAVQGGRFNMKFTFDGPSGFKPGRVLTGLGKEKPDDEIWMERISDKEVKFLRYDKTKKLVTEALWTKASDGITWLPPPDPVANFWKGEISKVELTEEFGSGIETGRFNAAFSFDGKDGYRPEVNPNGLGNGEAGDRVWMERINDHTVKFVRTSQRGEKKAEAVWARKENSTEWEKKKTISWTPLNKFWNHEMDELDISDVLKTGIQQGIFSLSFRFGIDGYQPGKLVTGLGFGEKDDRVTISREKEGVKLSRFNKDGVLQKEALWIPQPGTEEWHNNALLEKEKKIKSFWAKEIIELDLTEDFKTALQRGELSKAFRFGSIDGYQPQRLNIGIIFGEPTDRLKITWDGDAVRFSLYSSAGVLRDSALWFKKTNSDEWVNEKYLNWEEFWKHDIKSLDITKRLGRSAALDGVFSESFRFGGDNDYDPNSESIGLYRGTENDRIVMEWQDEKTIRFYRKSLTGEVVNQVDWQKDENSNEWFNVNRFEKEKLWKHLESFWSGEIHEMDITKLLGGFGKEGRFNKTFYFGKTERYLPGSITIGFGPDIKGDKVLLTRINDKSVRFDIYQGETLMAQATWIKKEQSAQWAEKSDYERHAFWTGHMPEIDITESLAGFGKKGKFSKSFVFGASDGYKPGTPPIGFEDPQKTDRIHMVYMDQDNVKFVLFNEGGERKEEAIWVRRGKEWVNKSELSLIQFWSRQIVQMEITEILGHKARFGLFSKAFRFGGPDGFKPPSASIGLEAGEDTDQIWMEWVDDQTIKFIRKKTDGQEESVLWQKKPDSQEWAKKEEYEFEQNFADFWARKIQTIELTKTLGRGIEVARFVFGFYFEDKNGFRPVNKTMGLGMGSQDDRIFMTWAGEDAVKFTRLDSSGNVKKEMIWRKNRTGEWMREDDFNSMQQEKVEQTTVDVMTSFVLELKPDQVKELVVRYGKDLKELLWALAGLKLGRQFDSEQVHDILDDKMIGLLDIDEHVSIQAKSTTTDMGPMRVLSQEEVKNMAEYIQHELDRLPATDSERDLLKEIAKKQAVRVIRKLEEQRFLTLYYDAANKDVVVATVKAINQAKEGLSEGIYKDALLELLSEYEGILDEYEELRSRGLNAKTLLNLYQLIGIHRIHEKKKVILSDEMGLGKTLQALAAFLLSGEEEMTVLAPNQVLERWMEDLADHIDVDIELVNLSSTPNHKKLQQRKNITAVTYTTAKERYDYFYKRPPVGKKKRIVLLNYEALPFFDSYRQEQGLPKPKTGFLVLDEVHWLKNEGAQRSSAIFGNGNSDPMEANYKVLISGTPLENKVSDLFSYLKYLAQGGSTAEEKAIMEMELSNLTRLFKKEKVDRISGLASYLSEHMIRRLKEHVLRGLPEKEKQTVWVDPLEGTLTIGKEVIALPIKAKGQHELYQQTLVNPQSLESLITVNGSSLIDSREETKGTTALKRLLRLEQLALDPQALGLSLKGVKLEALKHLVTKELNTKSERKPHGNSVLIFTTFKTVSEHVRQELEKLFPGEIAYIDGGVEQGERQEEIDQFQGKRKRIMVATIGTAGIGKNLTEGDAIIFLNLPWKPSTLDQAIDRVHRIDLERNIKGRIIKVMQMILDVPYSIDKVKMKVLERKRILNEMVINGNPSPRLMAAMEEVDDSLMDLLEEPTDELAWDDHDKKIHEDFLFKLGQALQSNDKKIWDEIAPLYAVLVERKASLFANIASLDYLSLRQDLNLTSSDDRPKQVLDLGSGPSTLYRAYLKLKESLNQRGVYFDITDFDASLEMLRQGFFRDGRQIKGTFEQLNELGSNQYDMVNISYAYRYSEHPAKLLRNIHRILKNDGLAIMILPKKDKIPGEFLNALTELGFEVKVGDREERLKSQLDEKTFGALKIKYGEEYAKDVARAANGEFTYLVARKSLVGELQELVTDDDVRIVREDLKMGRQKVENMKQEDVQSPIIPFEGTIKGSVEATLTSVLVVPKTQQKIRNFRKWLSGLVILMREGNETSDRNKFQGLVAGITERLETLEDRITVLRENMDDKDWESVTGILNNFKTEKSVRIWLRKNGLEAAVEGAIKAGLNDHAMKGGIDFNLKGIELETEEDEAMTASFEDSDWSNIEIDGLSPVIVSVRPVNLHMLLGL
jgi:SNF2 family DNA or RNA helicase/ubiquinone/menaquinone biosynthesis C-methylase UbiE